MTDKTAHDRILDAAADLVAERGYSAMTTRVLAERAGVNEVTIFRLFGSKRGVLHALGERIMAEGPAGDVAAPEPDEDLRSAVTRLAMRELHGAEAFGALSMRLAFDARSVPEIAEMMGEGPSANNAAIAAFFAEQQKAGHVRADLDPVVIADAFFALTSTYVMSRMLLGGHGTAQVSHEQAVRQMVDVLLTGIENKG